MFERRSFLSQSAGLHCVARLFFMLLLLLRRSCRSFSVVPGRRSQTFLSRTTSRHFSSKEDAIAAAFDEMARKEGFDSDVSMFADGSRFDRKDDSDASMDARIAQALDDRNRGEVSISNDMNDYFASLGFEEEEDPFGNDETPRNTLRPPPPQSALPILQAQLVTNPLACSACGSRFQSDKEQRPGYLPLEKFEQQQKLSEWKQRYDLMQKAESKEWSADDEVDFLLESAKENEPVDPEQAKAEDELDAEMLDLISNSKPVICKRCHRLQNHGSVEDTLRPGWTDDPALQQENFRRLLSPISGKTAVIIALVDLFDFAGSVLPELDWIAGEDNPVILAANKADLLPDSLGPNRAENWVRRELEYLGVKSLANVGGAVRLISCKTGAGVKSLLAKAEQLAAERDCDIYVVGAANAGKSTFLNHLLLQNTKGEGDGGMQPAVKKRAGNRNKFKGAVTTSPLPGTTLQFLKVELGNGRSLYDTPGLLVPGTITQLLSPEELKIVVPRNRVEPITFRVASGKAVLVGGLAKIELIGDCKPFLFTFFVANAIKLHPTDSSKADEFVNKHIGGLLTPPSSLERYKDMGEWDSHVITVDGMGWKQAAADITLTGLGWVGIMGAGEATVRISVPRGVGVMLRPPLMPFDVWKTTAKYTGARAVRRIGRAKYGAKKRTKGVGRN